MSHLSLKLSYRITETSFRRDVADSVKKVYGLDIGKGYIYRVLTLFKSKGSWVGPFPMVYDTGAVISLLPPKVLRDAKPGEVRTCEVNRYFT